LAASDFAAPTELFCCAFLPPNHIPTVFPSSIMSTEAFKPEAPSYSNLNSETSESANMSSEPPKMDAPVNSVLNADSETPESAQKAKPPRLITPQASGFVLLVSAVRV
jgi:hypothetical protein